MSFSTVASSRTRVHPAPSAASIRLPRDAISRSALASSISSTPSTARAPRRVVTFQAGRTFGRSLQALPVVSTHTTSTHDGLEPFRDKGIEALPRSLTTATHGLTRRLSQVDVVRDLRLYG